MTLVSSPTPTTLPLTRLFPVENGIAPVEIYHSDTAAAAATAAANSAVDTAVTTALGTLKLGDLSDVNITSATDGDKLTYDGTDTEWQNKA